MRRGGPPVLPVDAAAVPAFSRVERGPRGLRLAPAAPPAGAADDGGPPLRLRAGAPVAVRDAVVVAGGRLVLATAAGVAYTLSVPQMQVIHDRRPPGLDAAIGAPLANAGLLRAGDGWRAVVLPSLGDVAASLGPGPVAVRADGRRIAAAVDGGVEEWDLGTPDPVARHDGVPAALCYAGDGTLLAACGSRAAAPGAEPAEGSPIVSLSGASSAPRAVARHEDGSISVWESGAAEAIGSWPSPLAAAGPPALCPDGSLVAWGPPWARTPAPAWRARRTARSCARSPAPAPSPRPRPRTAASSAATGAAPG